MDRAETRPPKFDGDEDDQSPNSDGREDGQGPEPFMGVKVRRNVSRYRNYQGDYLDVPSRPYLMKVLDKQGDKKVLFADKVMKFTGSGKMKRRVLLITDVALYMFDPENALKRRVALAVIENMLLSKLCDNFFAIVIPTEYDLLMVSTRKTEIVKVLVDVTKSASDYHQLEVVCSNRFEYNAAANLVKEVHFEKVEGGIRTRIVKK